MVAEGQRATRLRERGSIATRLRRFWSEIEPGLSVDHDSTIERWDAQAEGRATCVSFEGFGITLLFFVGRTPKAVRS